jgi:predicted ATPase
MSGGGWLRAVALRLDDGPAAERHPFSIPGIAALAQGLALHPAVNFFVGENGSGKSTLLEGIAVAAGFNPEGGSRNFNFETRDSTSALHTRLRLVRHVRRPSTGYFLRAESFFNVATQVDELERLDPSILEAYGGHSLHEQSHGESFLALAMHRFGPNGLYLLDEPEAALSPQGCLALLRRIHDLVADGGQFLVATHSPLLIAYPHATVYELDDDGIEPIAYHRSRGYRLFETFMESPERFLHHLLDAGEALQ